MDLTEMTFCFSYLAQSLIKLRIEGLQMAEMDEASIRIIFLKFVQVPDNAEPKGGRRKCVQQCILPEVADISYVPVLHLSPGLTARNGSCGFVSHHPLKPMKLALYPCDFCTIPSLTQFRKCHATELETVSVFV